MKKTITVLKSVTPLQFDYPIISSSVNGIEKNPESAKSTHFPKDKVTRKFPPDFRATELCTCVQNVELSARLARFNKVTVPR